MSDHQAGYAGKILRVDLSSDKVSQETTDPLMLRKYIGGSGMGIKYLYDEVPAGVQWHDPGNRLIFASGPVGGTIVGGSGTVSIITKGPLTNGSASIQANGFFGAFLKLSGFDGVVVQGAAPRLVYLYIHDGDAEIRDAAHLAGKDTWQTEDVIKAELGKKEHELSVFSIGPAGENLIKFACIVGDRGHVASHNGPGAVMGSKRLKAIAVGRGKNKVKVADREALSFLAKELFQKVTGPGTEGYRLSRFGTTGDIKAVKSRMDKISLPIRNYTTTSFPEYIKFSREHIETLFEWKRSPCWACRFDHCRTLKVKEGPYAGYVGEEPEYEQWAHWGPCIGQPDPMGAFVLSAEVDRLGMDSNHAGWLIAWLMECYEKQLIVKEELDGLDLTWGNVEATLALMRKIAARQGIGDVLAKGIVEAVGHFRPEAQQLAIYTKKGNTPRAHDHRSNWHMMLDTCASDTGTDEGATQGFKPESVGFPEGTSKFSPEVAAKIVAKKIFNMPFDDSLGMCRFNNRGGGVDMKYMARVLQAITGWDFTGEEATAVGYRIVNLLRAFNVRHGLTPDLDWPSARYSSAPADGPYRGITAAPVWKETLENYYRFMGWDVQTGRPLPETLERLGLDFAIKDIWPKD